MSFLERARRNRLSALDTHSETEDTAPKPGARRLTPEEAAELTRALYTQMAPGKRASPSAVA